MLLLQLLLGTWYLILLLLLLLGIWYSVLGKVTCWDFQRSRCSNKTLFAEESRSNSSSHITSEAADQYHLPRNDSSSSILQSIRSTSSLAQQAEVKSWACVAASSPTPRTRLVVSGQNNGITSLKTVRLLTSAKKQRNVCPLVDSTLGV